MVVGWTVSTAGLGAIADEGGRVRVGSLFFSLLFRGFYLGFRFFEDGLIGRDWSYIKKERSLK